MITETSGDCKDLVENEVTFDCLLHLEEDDLTELGVAKGPRVK